MNRGITEKMYRVVLFILMFFVSSNMSTVAQINTDTIIDAQSLKNRIDLLQVNNIIFNADSILIARKPINVQIPKRILSQINIYDMPYSKNASYPNWQRLWINTGALYAAGFVALGVLEALPDSATNWNTEELRQTPWIQRWGNHVGKVMHWDGDNPIFNYILHPYGGAAYFMSARSQGFNFWESAIYGFCISTFFWEYGIEAFMEIPSIQDMIITPIAGALIGECFYKVKRKIVSNGYILCGSNLLGNIVAFLVDPVNEFVGLFAGNPCRKKLKEEQHRTRIALLPIIKSSPQHGAIYGITLDLTL